MSKCISFSRRRHVASHQGDSFARDAECGESTHEKPMPHICAVSRPRSSARHRGGNVRRFEILLARTALRFGECVERRDVLAAPRWTKSLDFSKSRRFSLSPSEYSITNRSRRQSIGRVVRFSSKLRFRPINFNATAIF